MSREGRPSGYRLQSWNRVPRALLFVDIVESVRLFEVDEEGTFERWHRLLEYIDHAVLPPRQGELVDILGDGALLAFPAVDLAVAAADAIFAASAETQTGVADHARIALRMGVAYADVIASQGKLYGSGVNLASRLMSLAQPGELVLSGAALEQMRGPRRDAAELIGNCFVKHRDAPVAAFRLKAPTSARPPTRRPLGPLKATLAIAPFGRRGSDDGTVGVVEGEIETALASSPSVDLLLDPLVDGDAPDRRAFEVAARMGVDYVLAGRCRRDGGRLRLSLGLLDVVDGRVVWRRGFGRDEEASDQGLARVAAAVATAIERGVFAAEWRRCHRAPLVTQRAAALTIAARGLMFRMSPAALDAAGRLLEVLVARSPREARTQTLRAQWFILRGLQGASVDAATVGSLADACLRTACDTEPDFALALATDAFLQAQLHRRPDVAERRLGAALALDRRDPLTQLLTSVVLALYDRGRPAVVHGDRALGLAPFDASRHFFEALAASAHFTAGNYGVAARLAGDSLRRCPGHKSSLRVFTAASWYVGRTDEARRAAAQFISREPQFRVGHYRRHAPNAGFDCGERMAAALAQAGLPT